MVQKYRPVFYPCLRHFSKSHFSNAKFLQTHKLWELRAQRLKENTMNRFRCEICVKLSWGDYTFIISSKHHPHTSPNIENARMEKSGEGVLWRESNNNLIRKSNNFCACCFLVWLLLFLFLFIWMLLWGCYDVSEYLSSDWSNSKDFNQQMQVYDSSLFSSLLFYPPLPSASWV